MQQDNLYYHDEDSLSGIDSDLIMGDPTEPPILKSLKHIGRSFREGGFCVPKKKDKPKSIKVKPPTVIAPTITETHCDSEEDLGKQDSFFLQHCTYFYLFLSLITYFPYCL